MFHFLEKEAPRQAMRAVLRDPPLQTQQAQTPRGGRLRNGERRDVASTHERRRTD